MTRKEIGKELKAARGKITAYKICRKAGLTYQQLSRMELGTSNYTIDSLIKLCIVLGKKIDIK